jgi:hypothetical protein
VQDRRGEGFELRGAGGREVDYLEVVSGEEGSEGAGFTRWLVIITTPAGELILKLHAPVPPLRVNVVRPGEVYTVRSFCRGMKLWGLRPSITQLQMRCGG